MYYQNPVSRDEKLLNENFIYLYIKRIAPKKCKKNT